MNIQNVAMKLLLSYDSAHKHINGFVNHTDSYDAFFRIQYEFIKYDIFSSAQHQTIYY
jgi:hypothetical protein